MYQLRARRQLKEKYLSRCLYIYEVTEGVQNEMKGSVYQKMSHNLSTKHLFLLFSI